MFKYCITVISKLEVLTEFQHETKHTVYVWPDLENWSNQDISTWFPFFQADFPKNVLQDLTPTEYLS